MSRRRLRLNRVHHQGLVDAQLTEECVEALLVVSDLGDHVVRLHLEEDPYRVAEVVLDDDARGLHPVRLPELVVRDDLHYFLPRSRAARAAALFCMSLPATVVGG